MTEFEHPWAAPATEMPLGRTHSLPRLDAAALRAKLREMRRDNTIDPWPAGYCAAVDELLKWLDNEA